MSIEVGSKWVKDGEVVEVVENCKHMCVMGTMNCTWFIYKNENLHVLTSDDFLRQYKPYEPVYEWKWVFIDKTYGHVQISEYKTESEFIEWQSKAYATLEYQRLDFTKQERT